MKKTVNYLASIGAVCFLFPLTLGAQGMVSILDKQTNPAEVLVEFDYRTTEIKGTYYLQDWISGNIFLSSGPVIKDQMIRYDLEYDILEVQFEDQVKVVPIRKLLGFTVNREGSKDQYFKNGGHYVFSDGTRLSGICEVVDTSYYGLLIKYEYFIKKADYVPELDMGTRNDQIKIAEEWMITIADTVFTIPRQKKQFCDIYGNREPGLRDFIQSNKLRPRHIDDIKLINEYLNRKKL